MTAKQKVNLLESIANESARHIMRMVLRKEGYFPCLRFCEDDIGAVYRVMDIKLYVEETGVLPCTEGAKEPFPNNVGLVVAKIVAEEEAYLVKTGWDEETPELIQNNYIPYELWVKKEQIGRIGEKIDREEDRMYSRNP